jgi:hypothetical protein
MADVDLPGIFVLDRLLDQHQKILDLLVKSDPRFPWPEMAAHSIRDVQRLITAFNSQ